MHLRYVTDVITLYKFSNERRPKILEDQELPTHA
jgi:hypothetical protein